MQNNNKIEPDAEDVLQHYKEMIPVPKDGLIKLMNNLRASPKKEAYFPWIIFVPVMGVMLIAVAGFTFYHLPQDKDAATGNPPAAVSSQGVSDATLDQDVSNIDGQLSGLTSDESNADQALSSQYQ